jgi:hypothetical protein
MKTAVFILNLIYAILGLALMAVTIRYPRAVFIELPLAILRGIFFNALPFDLADPAGAVTGKNLSNEYRTRRRRFITFSKTDKFMVTTGTDVGMVKIKINESLETLDEKMKFDEFKFICAADHTIIIPPKNISFYNFNYLIQSMTDDPVKTVGLVEGKRLSYTVYNDRKTINLIGCTNKGEKFFISLFDNFTKKQFLRINDDIETIPEYDVFAIKRTISERPVSMSDLKE